MFSSNALTLVLLFSAVKSDVIDKEQCRDVYMDVYTCANVNVTQYCADTSCLTKCCGVGEILDHRGLCMKIDAPIEKYAEIQLYSWDGVNVNRSSKKFTDFVLLQNEKFSNNCFFEYGPNKTFYILEDGSLKLQQINSLTRWISVSQLRFCVDYKVVPMTVNNAQKASIKLILRETLPDDSKETFLKSKFSAIGMLISCIFILVVLVLHILLPGLREKLINFMLMAYLSCLFATFLFKVVLAFGTEAGTLNSEHCKTIISPLFYFVALSSFVWLNIISFDLWRGLRSRNDQWFNINKREEKRRALRKFGLYCICGFGVPLVLAILVIVVDNIDITRWPSIVDPAFRNCFADEDVVIIYLNWPIGIIMFINVILFALVFVTIWRHQRDVAENEDSRSTKNNELNFITYFKIAVMMGLAWCLELIPDVTLWLYILINLVNILVGVVIFFVTVFNKEVLVMLCDKFRVSNEYIESIRPKSVINRTNTNPQSSRNPSP